MCNTKSPVTSIRVFLALIILAALWLGACQPAPLANQASTPSSGAAPAVPSVAASATTPLTAGVPLAPPVTETGETAPPAASPTPALQPTATLPAAVKTVALASESTPLPAPVAATAVVTDTPVYGYRVVSVFPHDPAAFTQGLVYQDSIFYEGTGLRGQSTLRKVDPTTGAVLQGIRLLDPYFGEGIAVVGDRLYQLTWQENTGFIYDKDSFELLDTWSYEGEGWGLATDGQRLIMSDGSNVLRFLDPATLRETGRVAVVDAAGQPVPRLNELEWVEDEVWANVWQTDLIARIDPGSGQLLGWIDLAGLLPDEDRATQRVDVLNGIAYDPATGRLFVTGKWWPKLFEIELAPEASP